MRVFLEKSSFLGIFCCNNYLYVLYYTHNDIGGDLMGIVYQTDSRSGITYV